MSNPLITTALKDAGIRLLTTLIERTQVYGEATDSAVYVILEHWIQDVLNEEKIAEALDQAQERFAPMAEAHKRWLEVFEELLQYAGPELDAFAQNLWRAYLFRAQRAAEILWDQYPEIQRAVSIETGRYLPRSWGEWILPTQTFMGMVEQCLVEKDRLFEDLFASEDLLFLIEEIPIKEPGPDFFRGKSVPIAPGDAYDKTTLVAYLNMCAERIGQIDPRGYPRSVHTTVPLADVYVPLRLVPIADYSQPEHFVRYETATYDDPELYAFHSPLGYREIDGKQGLTVSEVLNEHQQVLILGESGVGKTTLTRHLVLEYARVLLDDEANGMQTDTRSDGTTRFKLARPLPVYVDLAQYVDEHETDEPLHNFTLRWNKEKARDEDIPPLLETLLDSGKCLILLDGLDQVATDEQRRMLVSRVAEAANKWADKGNRIVVTSRFVGYDHAPLPRDFETFLIRPLDRSQINSFLLRWKVTLERMQRPLMGDDQAMKQAHLDTLELSRQITTNQRLYALVNSPLLLRMLVGVYRPRMMLTPQRVAVYKDVADSLIREWRLPHHSNKKTAVLENEVIQLLGELAYWLQASRPTGLLTEEELEQILGNIWHRLHPDTSPEQVHRAIGDFLGTLRMHAGVLVELAPKKYGFIYHGLQEYFAARYLVSSYRQAAQRIREHLHDPRWDEVIMLAIGFTSLQSRDDASDLIESAVLARGERAVQFGHASSPFESVLKRDLFFAARLLGTGVEANPDVTQYIIKQLMDFWLHGRRDSLGRFSLIFDSARRHLMYLDGVPSSRIGFQIALDHLDDPDERVQAFAVDALTFWSSYLNEAQEALVARGQRQPLLVRKATVCALGRMDMLSQEAYGLLLDLTADIDEEIRELAQEVLENAPPVPYEALSLWVDFLHSADPVRQRVSLRRLQQVGSLPAQVIGELLRLLGEQDPAIRQRAVDTLASVTNLPDDALTSICRTIADADPVFRASAIGAFARPVELPGQVIEQLIRWSDDPDVGVRHAALRALGVCKHTDEDVLDALIERLGDPSDSIRAATIEPLVLKGQEYGPALHMLRHVARDPIYQVRQALAEALRHISEPSEELQEVLYMLLSDREMIVREKTVETIRYISEPGSDIVDYLVSLADMPEHPIRHKSIETLASLNNLPDEAQLVLLGTLPVFGESLGDLIVDCLRRHVPLSNEVLNEVMDRAVATERDTEKDITLRVRSLEVLGYALGEAPAVIQIMLDAANQSNRMAVRAAAVRGMSHAYFMTPGMLESLTYLLKQGAFDVRCAAGITLGRLIRTLPDPLLEGDALLDVARELSYVLSELPAKSVWEHDTQTQNEVLRALSWVVGRARPVVPRLSAQSEDPRRYLDE